MKKHFFQPEHLLRRTALVLLASALLGATGCTKDPEPTGGNGVMRLALDMSLAEPSGVQAAFATSQTAGTQAALATRALSSSSPLPDGTEVLIEVYATNADIATATPIARGIYVQRGNVGGATEPTTDDGAISLRTGTYDFYFIAPSWAHTAGKVAVTGGTDFMTLRKSVTVEADPSGVFRLTVALVRRCAMLDVEVCIEDGGVFNAVALAPGEPLTVAGLADAADIPVDPATAFTATGTGYTATYEASRFDYPTIEEEGMMAYQDFNVLTTYLYGTHKGIPVLPGDYAELSAHAMLQLDVSVVKEVQATLQNVTLEAGNYYILRLKLNSRLGVGISIAGWKDSPGNGTERPGSVP